jgi:hypothetical protein
MGMAEVYSIVRVTPIYVNDPLMRCIVKVTLIRLGNCTNTKGGHQLANLNIYWINLSPNYSLLLYFYIFLLCWRSLDSPVRSHSSTVLYAFSGEYPFPTRTPIRINS